MRIFNIFIIGLNTLLLFALGALLVATALSPGWAADLGAAFRIYEAALGGGAAAPAAAALLGCGLMLLSVSTVVGNVRNRRFERTVVFHNPQGEVLIALGALEDLGKVVKAEIPGLKELKLRVLAGRKGLRVTARVTLWSDASLPKTAELIQESVRHYLREVVGIDQDIRPRVVVAKVAFRGPDDYEVAPAEMRPRRLRRPVL